MVSFNNRRKLAVAVAASFGLMGMADVALATDHTWVPGTVGQFNNASNWNPATVPGSGDNAFIGNGSSNIVTNQATFDCNGGNAAGQFGIYNMSAAGSTLTVNSWFRYGMVSGGAGAFNLAAGTVAIGTNQAGSNVNIGEVSGGTGALNVMGGAFNTSNSSAFQIGRDAGSVGTVNASGGVITLGGTTYLLIGNAGTGTFNVSGGTVNVTSAFASTYTQPGIAIGNLAGSTGTLIITSGLINDTATYGRVIVGNASAGAVVNQTGGSFNVSGTATPILIGNANGGRGVWNISGGSINGTNAGNNNIIEIGSATGGNGTMNVTGTGVVSTTASEVWVGQAGTGVLNINSGGVVNVGSWLAVGRGGGNGTVNIGVGGTLNKLATAGNITLAGTTEAFNISGGTLNNTTTQTWIAEVSGSTGVFNMLSGLANLGLTELGNNGGANGTLNLTGGVYQTTTLIKGGGTGTVNFNGGTLRANTGAVGATFMTGLTAANVQAGGAIIDNNGQNLVIGQPLLTGTAAGVQDGGLTVLGSGSLTLNGVSTFTGVTNLNGGSVILGSGLALQNSTLNFNNQGGTLAFGSLTAVSFGGLQGNQTLDLDNATPAAVALTIGSNNFNASYGGALTGAGSLTKVGTGLQTLSGTNTYAGGTFINAGGILPQGSQPFGAPGSTVTINTGGTIAVTSDADFAAVSGPTPTLPYTFNYNGGGFTFLNYSSSVSFTTPQPGSSSSTITLGVAPGQVSNYTGVISGTGSVTFGGAGQLNLAAGNTYSGGSVIQSGVVSIGNDTAVGGVAPTFTTAGVGFLQFQNGYTSNLGFASGPVNLNVASGSTATLAAGTSGNASLVYQGPGTLNLTGTSSSTGTTNVASGTIVTGPAALAAGQVTVANASALNAPSGLTSVTGPITVTGGSILSVGGTGLGSAGNLNIANGTFQFGTGNTTDPTAGRTVTIGAGGATFDTNGNNVAVAGGMGGPTSGTTVLTSVGAFNKVGVGTITDSGQIVATNFFIRGGGLAFSGSTAVGNSSGYSSVGFQPGDNGTLSLDNGAKFNGSGSDFNIADVASTTGATTVGVLNIADTGGLGTSLTAAAFYVGKGTSTAAATAIGTVNQTGGTLTINSIAIGQYGNGTYNLSGGSVVIVPAGDSRIANLPGSVGVLNLTGGTFTTPNNFQPGYAGVGGIVQTGGAFNHTGGFLAVGRATGGVGYYNISGGTFTDTGQFTIIGEQGTGYLNVSGTASFNSPKNMMLANADGTGGTGIVNQTGGTVTAPVVAIGGNNTFSATAPITAQYQLNGGTLVTSGFSQPQQTANVNSSVLLNGGTIQLSNNSAGLFGGVGSVVIGTPGALINTNGFNTTIRKSLTGGAGDGGLVKSGAGVLTVSASQTYTGVTNVSGGTLRLQSVAPVQAGLVAWYDAADASTLVTSGSNVTAILNKGTTGAQLNAVATATSGYATIGATQNGNNLLTLVNTPIYSTVANDPVYGTADRTLFVVGSRNTSAYLFNQGTLANNQAYGISIETGNTFGYTYANDVTFGTTTANTVAIVDTRLNSSGTNLTGDLVLANGTGTTVTPQSRTVAANTTQSAIQLLGRTGANSNGTFGEALEYNVALSDAQVAQVESYLAYKWYGIGTAPAAATNLLPTGTTVNLSTGGTLDLNGVNQSIAGISGDATTAVTLGTGNLTINNSTPQVFNGVIGGAGGLSVAGTSSFNLGGNSTFTGDTTVASGATLNVLGTLAPTGNVVSNGTINFAASTNGILVRTKGVLTVGSNGVINIGVNPVHANRTLLVATNIVLPADNSGKFDIGNSELDVTGGSMMVLNAAVASGFAGGLMNGKGIVSSTAAADTNHLTAVGIIQNNQGGSPVFTTFDNQPVGAADVLIKYTYFGDANLSGTVDGADYSLIDNGYNVNTAAGMNQLTGWYNGDFNYDGVIDGSDYTLIDNSYNRQMSNLTTAALVASPTALAGPSSAVPEPTSLGLLGITAAGLLGRRRRA